MASTHCALVSFGLQDTQRFAVGTVASVIVIYDLRTATKWRILEGHSFPISALAFGSSGSSMVSYSASERAIKCWETGGGFLGGILGMSGRCTKTTALPKTDFPRPIADVLNHCKLSFRKRKEAVLVREDTSSHVITLK